MSCVSIRYIDCPLWPVTKAVNMTSFRFRYFRFSLFAGAALSNNLGRFSHPMSVDILGRLVLTGTNQPFNLPTGTLTNLGISGCLPICPLQSIVVRAVESADLAVFMPLYPSPLLKIQDLVYSRLNRIVVASSSHFPRWLYSVSWFLFSRNAGRISEPCTKFLRSESFFWYASSHQSHLVYQRVSPSLLER